MSKKRTSDAKREPKERVEATGFGGAVQETPWPETKNRASVIAKKGGFDVERILFAGSLDTAIAYFAEEVAADRERFSEIQRLTPEVTFLQLVAERLASRLALYFTDGNDLTISPDAMKLALSFLYLFPKLWEALDKPLTLDEINALDFKELLSERRKVEIGKPESK